MSKNKPPDREVGGEEGSNRYYCPGCDKEYALPGECPECGNPLTNEPPVDPADKPIVKS